MRRVVLACVLCSIVGCGSSGPYPQSARIVSALKAATNDPSSLEVVDWGKPGPGQGDYTFAQIKIRAMNKKGAREIQQLNLWLNKDNKRWFITQPQGEDDPIDVVKLKTDN